MPSLAFNAVILNGCIQVIDLAPLHPDAVPIEESPDQVVQELKKMGYDITRYPIIYLDIYNRWDGLKVLNGSFDEYLEISCPTWERAVAVLLKNKIIDMPKQGDDLWDKPQQPWSGISGAGRIIMGVEALAPVPKKH